MRLKKEQPLPGFYPYNEIKLQLIPQVKSCDLQKVVSSNDAFIFCQQLYEPGTISFYESGFAVFLNRANKIIGFYKLSEGGTTGTVMDPRKIFIAALKVQATGIILTHNHPSGNLQPSRPDRDLTEKIKQAAVYLDMKVLDHIIVSEDEGYYSFADEGAL